MSHDDHSVAVHDGVQTVRDHHHGTFELCVDDVADDGVRAGIDGGRGLVEEEDAGGIATEEGARQAQQLQLPGGQAVPGLANLTL